LKAEGNRFANLADTVDFLARRSRKGFVQRLHGKIKITEEADQSCQDSSRIHAIKESSNSRICSVERSDMTTTLANQLPRSI